MHENLSDISPSPCLTAIYARLDRSLVKALFQNGGMALRDALKHAKASIKAKDVRRTYLLIGDPLLRLKAAQN